MLILKTLTTAAPAVEPEAAVDPHLMVDRIIEVALEVIKFAAAPAEHLI
jgi:hypothetical protein